MTVRRWPPFSESLAPVSMRRHIRSYKLDMPGADGYAVSSAQYAESGGLVPDNVS